MYTINIEYMKQYILKILSELFNSDHPLGIVRFTVNTDSPLNWPSFAQQYLLTNGYNSLKTGDVLVYCIHTDHTIREPKT